jgi:hypothetical protein
MKIIISPAKTLDYTTPAKTKKSSEPKFGKEALQLVKKMQGYSQKQIAKLMDLSDKLAQLNYERFEGWDAAPEKQAILAYKGDVYLGLDAITLNEKDFEFAQKHLRIISGLYGLLKPLDLIKPYRLEMSTAVGLYKFWEDKLTKELGDDMVINLASSEYSSAVKPKNMITVNFYETKNGKPKMVGIFAKKARGMMARYIIQKQITEPEAIKKFNSGGYKFDKKTSSEFIYNFVR